MGLTWDGPSITKQLWLMIHELTGVFPKATSLVRGSADANVVGYTTVLNISSGPYMLAGVRSDPDTSTGDIDVKITIDGTLVIEHTAVSPTADNDVIGLYFDDQTGGDKGPVLARSSIKIETRRNGVAGARNILWLYAGYSLA